MKRLAFALVAVLATDAIAKPRVVPRIPHNDVNAKVATPPHEPGHITPEDETAKQIQGLLRGPLRGAITGLFVVDAKTGAPVFSVNENDRLNPASNVKMISTAAALELVGPDFRYSTQLMAAPPDVHGAVRGDAYLLGTYDPMLNVASFDDIATGIAERGIVAMHGDLLVGGQSSRDGIYRASIPLEITGGATVGAVPLAKAPPGFDLLKIEVTAKTLGYAAKPRLTYKTSETTDDKGHKRVRVEIGGTIGKNVPTTYKLPLTGYRALTAAHALRAALRAKGVIVTGDVRIADLGDYVGSALARGEVPEELGRHDSKTLAEIVMIVNKWSVNWLADRVIMTTAALAKRQPPSMALALDAMYAWLDTHAGLERDDLVVDTGSGLSYKTAISARDLVTIVRNAGGFTNGDQAVEPTMSSAWLASLAIGGNDGTLTNRFRATDVRGRIKGKTGSLSTVIALSGVVDVDPSRPLAFALVTNSNTPLSKPFVRRTHELLVTTLCRYAERTAKGTEKELGDGEEPAVAAPALPAGLDPLDLEPTEDDDQVAH